MNITEENLKNSFEKNVDPKLRNQISQDTMKEGFAGMADALGQKQRPGRGR